MAYSVHKPAEKARAVRQIKKHPGFVEMVKRGSRLYGAILEISNGMRVYLALRSRAERFRSGELNVNIAESKGVDGWAIDESTLLDLRYRKIRVVGVLEYDSGEKFLAPIEAWEKAKAIDFSDRGGSLQKVLLTEAFLHGAGKTRYK
jgi:hypothetical protein